MCSYRVDAAALGRRLDENILAITRMLEAAMASDGNGRTVRGKS